MLIKLILQAMVGLSLAASLPTVVYGQSTEFSDELWQRLNQRKSVIENEINALTSHPWAGRYVYGGTFSYFELTIAPESGFAFSSNGCMGPYGLNYGAVQMTDGVLKLSSQEKYSRGDSWGISTELLLISWGDRHYVIPPTRIFDFINAVNAGAEPRKTTSGLFFLKWGDELKPIVGKPNLPEKYAGNLLDNPIQAKISSRQESQLKGKTVRTTVVLNVGRAQGVKVGMQFYFQNALHDYPPAVITAVNDFNSVAEFTQPVGDKHRPPTPGMSLSTLADLRNSK